MKKLFTKITTAFLILFMCVGLFPAATFAAPSSDTLMITGTYNYDQAYEVLDLANEEREAQGLPDLTMDQELMDAAMLRAAECSVYFSHTRPSGESWQGISSKAYGENIAAGQSNASTVMSSWMGSTDHRDNILRDGFQSIGIGCFVQDGVTYWVQDFGYDAANPASGGSNREETVSITINPSLFTDCLSLEISESEIEEGGSATVTVRFRNPEMSGTKVLDAGQFVWSSSSFSVSVDSSGVVTGQSAGDATITVATPAGGLQAYTQITVNGSEAEVPVDEEMGEEVTADTDTKEEVTDDTDTKEEVTDDTDTKEEVTGDADKEDDSADDTSAYVSLSPHLEMGPDSVTLHEGETYTLEPDIYWYSPDYPNGLKEEGSFVQDALDYAEGFFVTEEGEKVDISDSEAEMSDLLQYEFAGEGTLILTAGSLDEEYPAAAVVLRIVATGTTDWDESDPEGEWTATTKFEVSVLQADDEADVSEESLVSINDNNNNNNNISDSYNTNTTNNIDDRDDVDINLADIDVNDNHSNIITVLTDYFRPGHKKGEDATQTGNVVRAGHPKTGDNYLAVIYIVIIAGAAACIVGVLIYRRHRRA